MAIFGCLYKLDVLGVEASLYSHESSKKHQSSFGGLLSFLIFLLITAASSYFSYQFFNRQNFNLISSFRTDYTLSYEDFSDTPFMIRLSGNYNIAYSHNYYVLKMIFNEFDETVSNQQIREEVLMEPCDINKHFKKNKDLIETINDINTYYCPIYTRSMPIYGVYGSTWYSYHHITFKPCIEGITGKSCGDYATIMEDLKISYVDFVTISNKIDHYSSKPNTPQLYKGRVQVTISMFKRLWLYWQGVDYTTDSGYIFTSSHHDKFFNFYNVNVDVDLEAKDNAFIWVSLLNYDTKSYYERAYMKAQTLLANIGGIIKGLTIIGVIINYPISSNLFKANLINSIYNGKNSFTIERTSRFQNSNNLNSNNNGNLISQIEKSNFESQAHKEKFNSIHEHTNSNVFINNCDNVNSNSQQMIFNIKRYNKNTQSLFNNTDKNINASQNKLVKIDMRANSNNCLDKSQTAEQVHSHVNNNSNENDTNTHNNGLRFRNNFRSDNFNNSQQVLRDQSSHFISSSNKNRFNEHNNDKILVNNYTDDLQNAAFRKETDNQVSKFKSNASVTSVTIKRRLFTLGICSLLDPFQSCMKSQKKQEHETRLSHANKLLNVSNLISFLQEFDLFKKVFLERSQRSLLENINKKEPDMEELNITYNTMLSRAIFSNTAKKMIDNLEI